MCEPTGSLDFLPSAADAVDLGSFDNTAQPMFFDGFL